MKIYKKKSVSLEDETALVHLERRHTLKEDTNDADSDNLRKTIRANSLGSFGEGHSSTDVEAATAGKPSSFTRRPTVITESELSSSSLYKDRKAKINSDDESVDDPRPTLPPVDHENLEPRTLQDPKLKPTPVQRHRKTSSCCWYFTIVLVICIACLAVMAGVAGIVYMEYFAIYQEKDTENTNVLVQNDNLSASKEVRKHPPLEQDNIHRNEPEIPESILRRIIKNNTKLAAKNVARKVVVTRSQPNKDIFHNNDLIGSKNSETKELGEIKSSIVFENRDKETTENPKTGEQSDVSRNIHSRFNRFSVPFPDKSVEKQSNVKNQDSIDLNFDIQSKDITTKTRNGHKDEVNEQMTENESVVTEKSNFKAEVSDTSEESLSGRNFNFEEMSSLQGIELKVDQANPEIKLQNLKEFLLPEESLDHMDKFMNDNKEESSLDQRNLNIDHDLNDHIWNHSERFVDPSSNNSFDLIENSIDHNPNNNFLDLTEHFINTVDKSLKDHVEDSSVIDNDSSSAEQSLTVTVDDQNRDSDDSVQFDSNGSSSEEQSLTVTVDDQNLDSDDSAQFDPNDSSSKEQSLTVTVDDQNRDSDDSAQFDSNDSSSEEQSLTVTVDDQNRDSDDSAQLVFIRPIVESKAVPIPLAFLRRIGFDIKNPNSHQPLTAQDMDIKFSLAEALKYLRSLDTESKLPVSREKTSTPRTSNQKESKETKFPLKVEREEYLNLLRKHIFEESS